MGEVIDVFLADAESVLVEEVYFIFAELFTGKEFLLYEIVECALEDWLFNFAVQVVKYI
jgi:predicted nucleic-acid-binding protein